jgi:hypothetical protein
MNKFIKGFLLLLSITSFIIIARCTLPGDGPVDNVVPPGGEQSTVILGSAGNFAILAGSAITSTGNTVVTGNIGLDPGSSVKGFPPGTLNGVFHIGDPTAATAKLDLTTAFNDAAGRTGPTLLASELGGTTLTRGHYNSADGTFIITGTLTLDAQENANAVFIFQTASTLTTARNSRVVLAGGAQAGNVFWQVGNSATIGFNTIFTGTIMAKASITVHDGATIDGRALTQVSAVTLHNNVITSTTSAPTGAPNATPTAIPTETPAPGQAAVDLRSAINFAILAGSTITNTGITHVTGDIGLSTGTSVTGFPPGVLAGTLYIADATAETAKTDLSTAFNDAAARTGATTVGTELGGTTLTPGLYNSAAGTFGITGTLTLDGAGVYIFQAASTLITAPISSIVLINGAQAKNVFWQVGSSATLDTGTIFKGNILALTSITVNTGATIDGRALAQTGAVTLDTNTITKP